MSKLYRGTDKNHIRYYEKCSRWIRIGEELVTTKHSLSGYAEPDTMEGNKMILFSFRHNGRKYALDQFHRLDYPESCIDRDGKPIYFSGYDVEGSIYDPYLIELDESCTYCRLWLQADDVTIRLELDGDEYNEYIKNYNYNNYGSEYGY